MSRVACTYNAERLLAKAGSKAQWGGKSPKPWNEAKREWKGRSAVQAQRVSLLASTSSERLLLRRTLVRCSSRWYVKPRHEADSRLKQLPLGSAPLADQYNKVTLGNVNANFEARPQPETLFTFTFLLLLLYFAQDYVALVDG
jgi:hypothetical protein